MCAVCAVSLLLTSCSGSSEKDATISDVAMDMLTPISGDAFSAAAKELGGAMFRAEQSEWTTCVKAAGVDPDPTVGLELSPWTITDYPALPPVSRGLEAGTYLRPTSDAVRSLSAQQTEAYTSCGESTKAKFDGKKPLSTINKILTSSVGIDHQNLALSIGSSKSWDGSRECLRKAGAPADLINDYVTSARFADPSSPDATASEVAAQGRHNVEVWIDCTKDFRSGLEAKLKTNRKKALEENRQSFVDLTAAIDEARGG